MPQLTFQRARSEDKKRQRAAALVESLKTASTTGVPDLIEELRTYRRWAGRPLAGLLSSTENGSGRHLRASLAQRREEALLYRKLATLRHDVPLQERLSDLQWQGAYSRLKEICQALGDERIAARISRWR